jgi:predicted phage gp36 major capsid-like protein
MPRITDTAVLDDDMLETGGRSREAHMRSIDRDTREAEIDARTIERTESADMEWRRPTNLDSPPARPGYVQRWIRAQFRTDNDNLNWSQKIREGWSPRDPATIPDVSSYFPVRDHTAGNSVVQVGGLVLCEMPIAKAQSRKRAIAAATQRQIESVSADTDKASADARRLGVPGIEREDNVVSRVGRRPPTMA